MSKNGINLISELRERVFGKSFAKRKEELNEEVQAIGERGQQNNGQLSPEDRERIHKLEGEAEKMLAEENKKKEKLAQKTAKTQSASHKAPGGEGAQERGPKEFVNANGDIIERNDGDEGRWPFNKSKDRWAYREDLEALPADKVPWAQTNLDRLKAGTAPSFIMALNQNNGGEKAPTPRQTANTPRESIQRDIIDLREKERSGEITDEERAVLDSLDKFVRSRSGTSVPREEGGSVNSQPAAEKQPAPTANNSEQNAAPVPEKTPAQEQTAKKEGAQEYFNKRRAEQDRELEKSDRIKKKPLLQKAWDKIVDMPAPYRLAIGIGLLAIMLAPPSPGWLVGSAMVLKTGLTASSIQKLWRTFSGDKFRDWRNADALGQFALSFLTLYLLAELGGDAIADLFNGGDNMEVLAASDTQTPENEVPAPEVDGAEENAALITGEEGVDTVSESDTTDESATPESRIYNREDTEALAARMAADALDENVSTSVGGDFYNGEAGIADFSGFENQAIAGEEAVSVSVNDEVVNQTPIAPDGGVVLDSEVGGDVAGETPPETSNAVGTENENTTEASEITAEEALAAFDQGTAEGGVENTPEQVGVQEEVVTSATETLPEETALEDGVLSAEDLPQELSVEARPGDGAITMLMEWAEQAMDAGQTFPEGSPMAELTNGGFDGLYERAQQIAIDQGLYQPNEVAESFNVASKATLGIVSNPDDTVSFALQNPGGESHILWSSTGGDVPAYSGENMIDTTPDTSVAESRFFNREDTEALAQDVASRDAAGGVELSVDEAKEAAPKVLQDAADTQDLVAGTVQNAIAIQGEVAGLSGEAWGTLSNLPLPDVFSDPAATEAMRTQALMDLAWDNGIALGEEGADHLEHMIAMMQSPDMGATYGVVTTTDSDGMRSIADIFADGFRNRETGG